MKKIKIGLLPRIIIAIILGIAIGTIFPAPLVRIFVTFNGIFSEFLNFSIPLIIVGLVTVAIADIGKGAGKMLLVTALIAYGATLFSGFLSYFTGVTVFPSLIEVGAPLEEVSEAHGILPYFSVSIPPLMNVMTALILAFTLGLGLAALIYGGQLFVNGATGIARSMGVSESIIGLTLVAGGTSLPELATSIVAALKKNPEMAIGNVIGSNLFNIFFVLGCSASITPLHLSGITNFDLFTLVGSSILLWLFGLFFAKRTITRIEGSVMILCYVAYTVVLIYNS